MFWWKGMGEGMKDVVFFDKATLYLEIVVIYHYTFENTLSLPAV